MSYYLALLSRQDKPIYELKFGSSRQGGDGQPHFDKAMDDLTPFVVHAALDVVDDVQWTTPAMYLKTVDNFYSYMISAFVTAGNIRFMLVHETKNEESIRQFFSDVYDLYVKTLMSPFYRVTDKIQSPAFDAKVRALAKKYL